MSQPIAHDDRAHVSFIAHRGRFTVTISPNVSSREARDEFLWPNLPRENCDANQEVLNAKNRNEMLLPCKCAREKKNFAENELTDYNAIFFMIDKIIIHLKMRYLP